MTNTKILALTLSFVLTLTLAACGGTTPSSSQASVSSPENTSEPPSNVSASGDAEIIQTADTLFNEGVKVFWWYYDNVNENLSIDMETAPIEEYYLPVGTFKTMAELKEATEAVFSKQFCDVFFYPMITDYELFKEIDGVLYIHSGMGGMGWIYSLPKEIAVKSNEADKIVLTTICEGLDKINRENDQPVDYPFEFTLVNEGGAWKLNNWYYSILVANENGGPSFGFGFDWEYYLQPILFSAATRSSWTDPNTIDADMLVDMYSYMQIWNADIPQSEWEFKNDIPYYYLDEGILEEYVLSYFDLSIDHLRSSDRYSADRKAYAFNMSGVGFSYSPAVLRAEYDDASKVLVLYLDDGYGEMEGEAAALTIQLSNDGSFKYISNETKPAIMA